MTHDDYYFALPCYACSKDEFYSGDSVTHTAQCFDWAEARCDTDIPDHCSILFDNDGSPVNGCMTTIACITCPAGYQPIEDVLFGLKSSDLGDLLSLELHSIICDFACVKSNEKKIIPNK